ncbi:alpha/beta fold hydrolase [Curtobacterium sp. PhB115]|uniref:alpha/beta fold hydrolase n=1 Tax=Curtobacterium sp. PhB115 TaxID=2485173 RepID=UPI000FA5FE21|nr:alpha/beta fold hydrolase [Curtobacterium sp. PhB115]ROP74614.1 pimeloyl-ACP methyl ester carboxylesterase [Curtobacterium sp. PhB115]
MTPINSIEARGIRFALTDEGDGPVVLDAHGLTGSRRSGRDLGVADFSPVARAGLRLVSYDARGHGETRGTRDPADYGWDALGDDMLALADVLSPAAPVAAIGASMGTGSLLHAVTSQPARFDRLVLTSSPTAWETRAAQGDGYRQLADIVERGDPAVVRQWFAQAAPPVVFAGLEGFPPPPDVSFDLLPTVLRGAADTDLPPRDAIARITQPTLILGWPGDGAHPISTAEELALVIPGAELHVSETLDDIRSWGRRIAAFLSA